MMVATRARWRVGSNARSTGEKMGVFDRPSMLDSGDVERSSKSTEAGVVGAGDIGKDGTAVMAGVGGA